MIRMLAQRALKLSQSKDLSQIFQESSEIYNLLSQNTSKPSEHCIARFLAVTLSNKTYPKSQISFRQTEVAVLSLAGCFEEPVEHRNYPIPVIQ